MSKGNILNKIKLLDLINTDIWIKKKINQNERIKNIYILDALRNTHGDIISNFKIENPDRPNKAIVYPFALILLLLFGYSNYKRKA